MLLKKDEANSTDVVAIYDVSDTKWITIILNHDNSIDWIRLVDCLRPDLYFMDRYKASGLIYLENICTGENNEYLDTDILAAAEHCFEAIYEA